MKKLTFVTLSAALEISAILAPGGGAARPSYSITCTASTTALTWEQRTATVDYAWYDALVGGNQTGSGHIDVKSNGAGHTDVPTPPNSVIAAMSVTPAPILIPLATCT
jgi:hypothetical protein